MCAGARELRAPAPGKPQRPENRSARITAAPTRVFGRQTHRQTRASIRTSNLSTNPHRYSGVKHIDNPARNSDLGSYKVMRRSVYARHILCPSGPKTWKKRASCERKVKMKE